MVHAEMGEQKIERLAGSIDREVDNFHTTLPDFLSHGKAGLIYGLLFTALFWVCEFIIVSLLLIGSPSHPYLSNRLLYSSLSPCDDDPSHSRAHPASPRSSFTSLYGLFVNSSVLGILVVLWRSILFYFNILLGLIASLLIVQREAREPD